MLLLFCITTSAQQGINYKALIKDGSGVIVANTTIDVKFIILDGAVNVYEETHAPTTDANGIVILNIGEGTPITGTYSTIDWSSNNHFINVQIDTGGGLQDMGTTAFKTVPYALHANTAASSIMVIPLWQDSNYYMNNTSGSDLSNCESAFDPTVFNSLGNIEVRLVIRITSTSAGTNNFGLRTHDGTTQNFPIMNTDSWIFADTQSGIVATSPWKDFAAGTDLQEVHLFGWLDAGSTNFNSAYLMVRNDQ